MTGMLGVGIGEVVIPQLVKKNGVPLPVAAGTSILVVFLNAVGEWQEVRKLSLACTVRFLRVPCSIPPVLHLGLPLLPRLQHGG